jgi:pimeloyl-ACP methyl ester carboxylesterase
MTRIFSGSPKKSTIVRNLSRLEVSVRTLFRLAGPVAPGVMARLAEKLFFTPQPARSARIDRFVASGERFSFAAGGSEIAAWAWGTGPVVALVHGWAGLGGQLSEFVAPLVRAGFRVVTFDAPGHGQSGAGTSSLIHFADALEALARQVGPLHGVITHSMGGAATALSLTRGLAVKRLVFISPPAWPRRFTDVLASRLAIPEKVMDLMRARAERRFGFAWNELSVPPMARTRREPLLVIHDEGDRDVPVEDGVAIADSWPGAALVRTTGLGHRHVLKDAGVIALAVSFIEGVSLEALYPAAWEPLARDGSSPPEEQMTRAVAADSLFGRRGGATFDQATLERVLFDRELRALTW